MPLKVTRKEGAPGGDCYKLRFPEGLCPVPMTGVVTKGPLPDHVHTDPWLEIVEVSGYKGRVPTVPQYLEMLEEEREWKAQRDTKAKIEADAELAAQTATGTGKSAVDQQIDSGVAHLIVRAKGRARKADAPNPDDTWDDFVDEAELAALAKLAGKEPTEALNEIVETGALARTLPEPEELLEADAGDSDDGGSEDLLAEFLEITTKKALVEFIEEHEIDVDTSLNKEALFDAVEELLEADAGDDDDGGDEAGDE